MLHNDFNKREFPQSFDPPYDSSYLITDIRVFARPLASLAQNEFKLQDINNDVLKRMEDLPLNEFRNTQLAVVMDPVSHVDARKSILDQQNMDDSVNIFDRKKEILFLKEEKDSLQREFRIAFIYTHGLLGMIPVKKAPEILAVTL